MQRNKKDDFKDELDLLMIEVEIISKEIADLKKENKLLELDILKKQQYFQKLQLIQEK